MSRLEPDETLRFDRALYRYWLYWDMVEVGLFDDNEHDDDDDEDEEKSDIERDERLARVGLIEVISDLSTEEICQIYHIGSFCEETLRWQKHAFAPAYGQSSPRLGVDGVKC